MRGREVFAESFASLKASRIESASAATRALVSFVLGTETFQDVLVRSEQSSRIHALIERHKAGCPISKLIGRKYFWDKPFFVNAHVLDPRPDSETLIEAALRIIPENSSAHLLDFGTGSGCLLETLLFQRPHLLGLGVDCSLDALYVAQKNAFHLGVAPRAYFVCSDWGAALDPQQKWDIIVANPPYIACREIPTLPLAVRFDPLIALQGGEDGLACYRALALYIQKLLSPQGHVFLEIGPHQSAAVKEIFNFLFYRGAYQDLSGKVRVLHFSS
jgi:release factor glutamine methyltransferase